MNNKSNVGIVSVAGRRKSFSAVLTACNAEITAVYYIREEILITHRRF